MKKHLNMSVKEIDRVPIIKKAVEGEMTAGQVSSVLGLSTRQVKRLKVRFRKFGASGLIHKSRGRIGNRAISGKEIGRIIGIVKEKYFDFGPTFALEKLKESHNVGIGRERLRLAMISEGLWRVKKRKVVKIYQQRERRKKEGELVQADGSPHAWFEDRGPNCTLLVFVDDATGKIKNAHFSVSETTNDYFVTIKGYIQDHGKPLSLYVDRHSIFVVSNNRVNPKKPTQFTRAMDELGIEVILANSPQAKGRVEKINFTLQDRLVKEMRLRGISNIKGGNKYLPKFIKTFNKRFSVKPREILDAHRPLLPSEDLTEILVKKYTRVLSKNLEFQYENKLYQIKSDRPTYAMRSAVVTITKDIKNKVRVYYKEQELKYVVMERKPKQEVISTKEVNQRVDKIIKRKKVTIPAENHPWRYFSI